MLEQWSDHWPLHIVPGTIIVSSNPIFLQHCKLNPTPYPPPRIVNKLLPEEHLLRASTSRLRALILEELAYNKIESREGRQLLKEGKIWSREKEGMCLFAYN